MQACVPRTRRQRLTCSGRGAARRLFAAWCTAEPGPSRTPAFGTVPVLRSSVAATLRFACAAARPGNGQAFLIQLSNSPSFWKHAIAIPRRLGARGVLHSLALSKSRGRAERRVPDAPMGLCALVVSAHKALPRSHRETARRSARSGVNGLYVLSLAATVVAIPRLRRFPPPVEGGSPSGSMPRLASGPHDFPVRASVGRQRFLPTLTDPCGCPP